MLYEIKQTVVAPSGAPLASQNIEINRSGTTTGLRLYSATGALLSPTGQTTTDANGNINVYVGENVAVDIVMPNNQGSIQGVYPTQSAVQVSDQRSLELTIATAANAAYTLTLSAPFSGVITKTLAQAVSGTCTATFAIAGTPLGGTPNPVSSTLSSEAQASANTFTTGQAITVTISANATALGVALTVLLTKTGD